MMKRTCFCLLVVAPCLSAVGATPSIGPVGFAAVNAHGMDTTTGGGNARVVVVRNAKELLAALESSKKEKGEPAPRVVRVEGDIDLGELDNEKPGEVLKHVGRVQIASNTTVFAAGEGATLRHGTLEVHGTHNIIIRNLKFRDLWEEDPTGKYDRFGWDYVRITNSGKMHAHHVWVDHCDFEKAYDGLLDVTHGSDLVTVSWCRFAGDARGPQKKASLIGHSSGKSAAEVDHGRLNVTLHHNLFEGIDDRSPRARFGNIHFFNNVVSGAKNATISVSGAATLVDNVVYNDCQVATSFSHAADCVRKNLGGSLLIVNSRNTNPRPPSKSDDEDDAFEAARNFQNSGDAASFQFNAPADWSWADIKKLPYSYQADPVERVEEIVRKSAGAGKLSDAELK